MEMTFLSWEFFAALGSIIILDLVLAGDNAVVIAMAANTLPAQLRKKAILIGTAGAVVVRLLMTLAALPLTRGMPRQLKLAFLISCGVINNVLLMIVCMEFFSATEALMAAAYLVPLYILLFYYRLCSRKPPLGA